MVQYVYQRDTVPVGEKLKLEIQFNDSAGNAKDADATPNIQIRDAVGTTAFVQTTSGVTRIGLGHYRYELTVPDGYISGVWNDIWRGSLDGYAITNIFDFRVDSKGDIQAVGTIVEPDSVLGDDVVDNWNQAEIKNLNILLRMLKARLRNNAYDASGNPCNVFADNDLITFLCASLSEFNMTPTLTSYTFEDINTSTLFADVLTQGAMLVAWSGQAILESGREFTITDNGVVVQPPPVSSTINTQYSANLADYRSKLKEIKRNLRPSAVGMGAGSILTSNPSVRRLRHLAERRII